MSLVTRCPTCSTTFKVVRDQLRISDGWVRCGRCSEVFDAMLDLQELSETAPAAQAESPGLEPEPAPDELAAATPPEDSNSKEAPPPAPDPAPVPHDGGQSAGTGIFLFNPDDFVAEVPQPPVVIPVRTSFPPFPQIDLSLPARPPFGYRSPVQAAEDHDAAQLQKALRRARVRAAKVARAKAREAEKARGAVRNSRPMMLSASEPELSLPPVLPVARRPVRPPDAPDVSAAPGMRVERRLGLLSNRRSLIAFVIVGVAALIFQVLRQERDLIVAREPGLQPVFAALCALTGCELSPLRQIRDITIEGASFAREKGSSDAYRLSFTLRNGASLPLAMPAIELTLLDLQERAVVRRVLVPGEFGAPPVLAANAERASSMLVTLSGPEAAVAPPVAGFRVEAMYP
jgi:predicted Zn finger-like uncharacterized protein